MTMLKEEIDILLNKFQREFLDFVAFIKDVETEYNKSLPESKHNSSHHRQQNIPEQSPRDISVEDYSAIVDAISIVNDVLVRMSHSIHAFSSLAPPEDEKNSKSGDSYLLKFYYAKYVYQIAACLMKIVEQYLGSFAEKLDLLASSTNEERKRHLRPPKFKKFPEVHRYDKYFRPLVVGDDARVHSEAEDYKCRSARYPEAEDYKCRLASYPEAGSESSSEFSSEYESDSSNEEGCVHDRDDPNEFEGTREILCDLASTIGKLTEAVEGLLRLLKKSTCEASTERPFSSSFDRDFRDRTFPRSEVNDCCSVDCDQCCSFCRNLHREKKKSEEHNKNERSWADYLGLTLIKEPFWMETNPAASRNSRKVFPHHIEMETAKHGHDMPCQTSKSNYTPVKNKREYHQTHSKKDHATQYSPVNSDFQIYDFGNMAKCSKKQGPCSSKDYNDLLRQHRLADGIQPGMHTRKLSTGNLNPKRKMVKPKRRRTRSVKLIRSHSPEGSEHGNKLLSSELRSYLQKELCKRDDKKCEKVHCSREITTAGEDSNRREQCGKISAENVEKPVFLGDIQPKISCKRHPGKKQDDVCLLPGTELLVDKSRRADYIYPHAVSLNIYAFANILGDKFKETFKDNSEARKTESERVFDIILDSLHESLCIFYEEGKVIGEDEKTETIDKTSEMIKQTTRIDQPTEMVDKTAEIDNAVDAEKEKTVYNYLCEIINTASKVAQSGEKHNKRVLDFEIKKALKGLDIVTVESKGEQSVAVIIPKDCRVEKEDIPQACEDCIKMIKPYVSYSEKTSTDKTKLKYMGREMLKGICFHCWNGRERGGLTIHQCHESLPSDILEVRHMDEYGKICVCFLKWVRRFEKEDWRWLKSPYHGSTRVVLQQAASEDRDPVLNVIYGPEGNYVKESLAETNLEVVKDYPFPKTFSYDIRTNTTSGEERSLSTSYLESPEKSCLQPWMLKSGRRERTKLSLDDKSILTKLGHFFDDIQKVGYGNGPPLVLKLRKSTILNDALNLLMAPSKINLSYYRSLRMLLTSDDWSIESPSSTNFTSEDQSNEVFALFARKLFTSSDLRLFVYPSEETQYLYLNPEPISHPHWLAFAGVVLGLALMHQKQMEISLAPCLMKCLLGRPLGLNDLNEIDPQFHQTLMWLKENDISTRKAKLFFSIKDKVAGKYYENDLMVNGKNIEVTEKNKYRYIELAIKWKLAERCLAQLKDFRRGFISVVQPSFFAQFSERELLSLLRDPPNTALFLEESSSNKSSREILRRGTW